MNYYVVLGVPQDADADTIRSAFRALVRQYHPDAGEGSSVQKFRQILTAYETLNDPIRRGHYDRDLHRGPARVPQFVSVEPLTPSSAPEPLLGWQRERAHRPTRPTRLDDLIDEFFRSWEEAFFGGLWRDRG